MKVSPKSLPCTCFSGWFCFFGDLRRAPRPANTLRLPYILGGGYGRSADDSHTESINGESDIDTPTVCLTAQNHASPHALDCAGDSPHNVTRGQVMAYYGLKLLTQILADVYRKRQHASTISQKPPLIVGGVGNVPESKTLFDTTFKFAPKRPH